MQHSARLVRSGLGVMAGALTVCLAASVVGCGSAAANLGPAYPAKGKVTLPDGKTMPGLRVIFSGPTNDSAITESDGTFAFTGQKTGLPAGDYKVRLEIASTAKASQKATLPFPSRYLDEDFSGLKAKVMADGPNDFDFKLTKDDPSADRSLGPGAGRVKGRG
jgi:Carboxypeptidase regulatory-like domain